MNSPKEPSKEVIDKLHAAGFVTKYDTLKDFRMSIWLTPEAMAQEMGLREDVYLRLEEGKTKTKHFHLKAALNIIRLHNLNCSKQEAATNLFNPSSFYRK